MENSLKFKKNKHTHTGFKIQGRFSEFYTKSRSVYFFDFNFNQKKKQ